MSASRWTIIEPDGEIVDVEAIDEGQPSLYAWESQVRPEDLYIPTLADRVSIDAAQSAIRMLVHFVEHVKAGKREATLTLEQIGHALAGEVI